MKCTWNNIEKTLKLNMHHTLHPKSDVDRLYLPQKTWGHWLLQINEVVEEEKRSLNDFISTSREKLLKAVKMENTLKRTETKAQYKKQQFENLIAGQINHYMDNTWEILMESMIIIQYGHG